MLTKKQQRPRDYYSQITDVDADLITADRDSVLRALRPALHSDLGDYWSIYSGKKYLSAVMGNPQRQHSQGDDDLDSIRLAPGTFIPGTGFKVKNLDEWYAVMSDEIKESCPPLPDLNLTTQDINRWKMAWRAFEACKQPGYGDSYRFSGMTFVRRCHDLPDLKDPSDFYLTLGLSAAAMVYGGLHALAWSAHFSSSIQQLLWRISACVVMGGFPPFYLVRLWHLYLNKLYWRELNKHKIRALQCCSLLARYGSFLVLGLYLSARAYLVVECFLQLSHMPAGVYAVPRWSAYFPHIS